MVGKVFFEHYFFYFPTGTFPITVTTDTKACVRESCCQGTLARRRPGPRLHVYWNGGLTGSGSTRHWNSQCPTARQWQQALNHGRGVTRLLPPCWLRGASPSATDGRWRWTTTSETGSITCLIPYPKWKRRLDIRSADSRPTHRNRRRRWLLFRRYRVQSLRVSDLPFKYSHVLSIYIIWLFFTFNITALKWTFCSFVYIYPHHHRLPCYS